MTRDETMNLLRTRSALTSQPYGDEAIDAWREALDEWTYEQCRRALMRAARGDKRVTVGHVVELLPHRSPPDSSAPERREPGCECGVQLCEMHRERAARWLAIIRAEIATA